MDATTIVKRQPLHPQPMKFPRILTFSCLVILTLPLSVPGTRGVVLPDIRANQSRTTSVHTNSTFTFTQMPLPPITSLTTSTTISTTSSNTNNLSIIAVTAAVAIAIILIWVMRSARKKLSIEKDPSKTAGTGVKKGGIKRPIEAASPNCLP